MSASAMPAVLTVEEAAKVLRIGRTAAYEAARRGELPVIRVGRSLRVPRQRLEALLKGEAPAVAGASHQNLVIRAEGEDHGSG